MLFILRGVRLLAHRRNLAEAGLLLRLTELRMLHRRLERRARLFCLRLLALWSLCGLFRLRSLCGLLRLRLLHRLFALRCLCRLFRLRLLHRLLALRSLCRLFRLRLLHRLLALRSLCRLLVLRCGVPGFGGRLFVILIAAVQRCFVVHVEVVHDTDLLLLFAGTFRSLC